MHVQPVACVESATRDDHWLRGSNTSKHKGSQMLSASRGGGIGANETEYLEHDVERGPRIREIEDQGWEYVR